MPLSKLIQTISDNNQRFKVVDEITKEFTIKFQDHIVTINQKFKLFMDIVKSGACFKPINEHPLLGYIRSQPEGVVRNIGQTPFNWK